MKTTPNVSSNGNNERLKALELAIGQIEKQFGRGSIMRLGEASARMTVETIPTGSLALDIALGSGVPRGRITEIYGPEMAGKSTVAMHIIAQAQKLGGLPAYIDVAHAIEFGALPGIRDPMDRMIVAAARVTGSPLVTADEALRDHGVETDWD